MKNRLIYNLSLLFAATAFFACEEQTTPEPIRVQHPIEQAPILRDDAYFARLRAYKQSDHKLAFGWFGSWSAIEASEQCRLRSAPDSMDIISMWSQWHSLSPAQIEDKAYVQKIKGTKVVICISARDVPAEFKEGGTANGAITDESLVAYAKAWGLDSMEKYQYDGIDIDFETAVDHLGPLNSTPGLFKKFCLELSQYIGPKSNTGRLFLIDGNINSLDDGIAELCTYGVSQAYNCSGPTDLQGRTASAGYRGWKADQLIFTENFESLWKSGGVTYWDQDGTLRPSLLGMASFAKQTAARGFGAYHMEYEYGHSDMPYKYMRQAIQLANPAPKGDYSKNLVSLNETEDETVEIRILPNGSQRPTSYQTVLTATLSQPAKSDVSIPFKIDNARVGAYNDYNYTDMKSVDPSVVSFSGVLHFAAGSTTSEESVTLQIADLSVVELNQTYMIPVVIDFSGLKGFAPNENKQVKQIFLSKMKVDINIEEGATSIDGTVIEDRTGWICTVEGTDSGAAAGLNNAEMFDGNNKQLGWYSSNGGKRAMQIDMQKTQTIIGWRMGLILGDVGYTTLKLYNIQTSTDGTTWKDQSKPDVAISVGAPDAAMWQYVKFFTPVACRYVRLVYENAGGSSSGGFIGCNEWNAIAPKN